MSETHATQALAVGELRREITAIEASIKLTGAHLRKVVHEKLGYVEQSRRFALDADILRMGLNAQMLRLTSDADILIDRMTRETRLSEARMVDRIERLEKFAPRSGGGKLMRNAQNHFERFERMVLEKEGKAEQSASPPYDGLSAADDELIEGMMVKLDRAVEGLEQHVSAMFTFLVASDPSVENAYERLITQLNEARRLAERSLLEEFSLETHLNQFRCSERANNAEELASLVDNVRKHKFNNISIDQQLFRADCVAKRILILKLLLSADPGVLEEELFAYKSLLKAFSSFLEKGWNEELREDAHDGVNEGPALLSRLSALESRVQMSFLKLAKTKLINLPEDKIVALGKKAPDTVTTIEHEIEEQKTKLALWQKVLLDADESGARLVRFVASQRIEQSVEVIQSLERSAEVMAIILVLIQTHQKRIEKIAQ